MILSTDYRRRHCHSDVRWHVHVSRKVFMLASVAAAEMQAITAYRMKPVHWVRGVHGKKCVDAAARITKEACSHLTSSPCGFCTIDGRSFGLCCRLELPRLRKLNRRDDLAEICHVINSLQVYAAATFVLEVRSEPLHVLGVPRMFSNFF